MAIKKRSIFYAGSLAAGLLIASVGKWEGVRYTAYRDLVGVPTICYGETRNVKMGMKMTPEQCEAMLEPRLKEFESEVLACTSPELPEKSQAAFVHFAYNVGSGWYCKSVAPLVNKGNLTAACDKMGEFANARDRKTGKLYRINGLVKRRAAEMKLCHEGAKEGVNVVGYVYKLTAWVSKSFTG